MKYFEAIKDNDKFSVRINKKMSIEFSEEKKFNEAFQNEPKKMSGMTKWFIDQKFAKDEKGAKNIMLFISFVCLALAIYFFLK